MLIHFNRCTDDQYVQQALERSVLSNLLMDMHCVLSSALHCGELWHLLALR